MKRFWSICLHSASGLDDDMAIGHVEGRRMEIMDREPRGEKTYIRKIMLDKFLHVYNAYIGEPSKGEYLPIAVNSGMENMKCFVYTASHAFVSSACFIQLMVFLQIVVSSGGTRTTFKLLASSVVHFFDHIRCLFG